MERGEELRAADGLKQSSTNRVTPVLTLTNLLSRGHFSSAIKFLPSQYPRKKLAMAEADGGEA